MVLMSWTGLKERCPLDISRLITHENSFNCFVNVKISITNINKAKKSLLDARGELDIIVVALQQILHNREILRAKTDEFLYSMLIDNIGRYFGRLDEKEEELLVKYDEINNDIKRVGISRVASYAKLLKTTNCIIYEAFSKAIIEWENFKETEEIKKDNRTFLYIFFDIFQISLSSIGGIAREVKSPSSKKGQTNSTPTTLSSYGNYLNTWQDNLSEKGQKKIAEEYKKETGQEDSPLEDFMLEKEPKVQETEDSYSEEFFEGEEKEDSEDGSF